MSLQVHELSDEACSVRCEESSDSSSSPRSLLRTFSFEKWARILCILILAAFALYLLESLADTIKLVLYRWSSKRALNLDLKLSLLFELSHILSLPFAIYLLSRGLVYDGSEEA